MAVQGLEQSGWSLQLGMVSLCLERARRQYAKCLYLEGGRKMVYKVTMLEEGGEVVGKVSGCAKCPWLDMSSLPEYVLWVAKHDPYSSTRSALRGRPCERCGSIVGLTATIAC